VQKVNRGYRDLQRFVLEQIRDAYAKSPRAT